jgi:hypothetical protein
LVCACGRKIGDDCQTNIQCSPQGDRECDLSQPDGYCTIEGCTQNSCPDDALCVRFFPPQALDPKHTCDPNNDSACSIREICLPQQTIAYCVEPRLEHRYCMKSCSSNGDCRDGYECRQTGIGGAEPLPGPNGSPPGKGGYCTARPIPSSPGSDASAPADGPPGNDAQAPDAPNTEAPAPDAAADAPAPDAGPDAGG